MKFDTVREHISNVGAHLTPYLLILFADLFLFSAALAITDRPFGSLPYPEKGSVLALFVSVLTAQSMYYDLQATQALNELRDRVFHLGQMLCPSATFFLSALVLVTTVEPNLPTVVSSVLAAVYFLPFIAWDVLALRALDSDNATTSEQGEDVQVLDNIKNLRADDVLTFVIFSALSVVILSISRSDMCASLCAPWLFAGIISFHASYSGVQYYRSSDLGWSLPVSGLPNWLFYTSLMLFTALSAMALWFDVGVEFLRIVIPGL